MNKNMFLKIINDNGKITEYEILLSFFWLKTNKNYMRGKKISNQELQKFKQLGKIYIVSNYKQGDLLAALEYNNFDESMFEEIISNDLSKPENLDKFKIYQEIMQKSNLKPNQILVVGNNFKHDLQSAKKLGMHYYLVKDGFTYDEILT